MRVRPNGSTRAGLMKTPFKRQIRHRSVIVSRVKFAVRGKKVKRGKLLTRLIDRLVYIYMHIMHPNGIISSEIIGHLLYDSQI